MGEPRYETLMTSLPYHGRLFGARQTPLSRFQLDKRLAWLRPDDARSLQMIEDVLQWRRLLLAETDADFLRRANALIDELDNALLNEVVRARLETRTLIAALRMRKLGRPPPDPRRPWGFGRWPDFIRRHWTEPDFGLGHMYPWVADAEQLMRNDDALGLERQFLDRAWRQLSRAGAGHYFDFEAVAIYVLRWDLIDRWTHYDEVASRDRILSLAEEGLGEFGRLYH